MRIGSRSVMTPQRDSDTSSFGNLRRRVPSQTFSPIGGFVPSYVRNYQPGQPLGYLRARGTIYQHKFMSRKLCFCCIFVAPIAVLISIVILLRPVLLAVANHSLSTSVLSVSGASITMPSDESFAMTMEGAVMRSGPFPATIHFRAPIQVFWVTPPEEGRKEVNLGQFRLGSIKVAGGKGSIKQAITFEVKDRAAFGSFARFLITQPELTWKLVCPSVHVKAFGFLSPYKDLEFAKHLVMRGFNGFEDVKILDFKLPGDDPKGGIAMEAVTSLTNPSSFSVSLGVLNVGLYYRGLYLGPASSDDMNVTAGVNTFTLRGRLVSHADDPAALQTLGELFTSYINDGIVQTEARGLSVTRPQEVDCAWLSEGVKALKIKVPLKSPQTLRPIKSIDIGALSLAYTAQTAYSPIASSSNLSATMALPFGFSLSVAETSNTITLISDDAPVAVIEGAFSNSTSKMGHPAPGQTEGDLHITMPPSTMRLPEQSPAAKTRLEDFQSRLTNGDGASVRLQGIARAVTDTPVGRVLLDGIKFDVDSSLKGLQGLSKYPTLINSVDVTGGTRQGIQLAVCTTLFNPSNLELSIGDTRLHLERSGTILGTVTMPDLHMVQGHNDVNATSVMDPNTSPVGLDLLNRFVAGQDTLIDIKGFDKTTDVASLLPALSSLRLNATLPGLKAPLVTSTAIVIPKDIAQTSTAMASFVLQNPFSATIKMLKVKAKASYGGIVLGVISQDLSSKPIVAPGHAPTKSTELPFHFDLDPKNLIRFVTTAAKATNTDLGPLPVLFDPVMAMKSTETTIRPRPDEDKPACNSGNQFDVKGAVLRTVKTLTTTLDIETGVAMGDYETSLRFQQSNVPTFTDESLLYLLGPAGAPIVQNIVDESVMTVGITNITNVTGDGFDVSLQGSLLDTGPLDAVIEFPEGLLVNWEGADIAVLSLPPICARAGEGVPNLLLSGKLKITDTAAFTKYATYILHNAGFEWTLHSPALRVRALGIVYDNVKISKKISFKAFNNLPGAEAFDFDIIGETSNSLTMTTGVKLTSPATMGIQLDTANFEIFYKNSLVGQVHSEDFFLVPNGTTTSKLKGSITDKKGSDKELANTGLLFTNFLKGQEFPITVRGVSVATRANGGKEVGWLSAAFHTLELTVTMTGKTFDIISSITMSDMTVKVLGDPTNTFVVPTSSSSTVANFINPFHFSLQPVRTSTSIVIVYRGAQTAKLELPMGDVESGTSRGPKDVQPLYLSWKDQDLTAIDRSSFQAFFAQLTLAAVGEFDLFGSADIVARTVIGDVAISGVRFHVTTSLSGMDSFKGVTTLSHMRVADGNRDFLWIPLQVGLYNPSNVTIVTLETFLPCLFGGVYVGRAELPELILKPGNNTVQAFFYYAPREANSTVAQEMMTRYVQPSLTDGKSPQSAELKIDGSQALQANLTAYAALQPALAGLKLDAVLPGVGQRMVSQVRVFLTMGTILSGLKGAVDQSAPTIVEMTLSMSNGLDTGLHLTAIQTSSKVAGPQPRDASNPDATLSYTFPKPFSIPAGGVNVTSDRIPNVVLPKGLMGSVSLLGKNMDVYNQISCLLGPSPDEAYFVPALQYSQLDVETKFFLDGQPPTEINIPPGVTDLLGVFAKLIPGAGGGGAGDAGGGLLHLLGRSEEGDPFSSAKRREGGEKGTRKREVQTWCAMANMVPSRNEAEAEEVRRLCDSHGHRIERRGSSTPSSSYTVKSSTSPSNGSETSAQAKTPHHSPPSPLLPDTRPERQGKAAPPVRLGDVSHPHLGHARMARRKRMGGPVGGGLHHRN